MFIEQGNLFNSINFNLAPETPGMAGDVPFMPPFQMRIGKTPRAQESRWPHSSALRTLLRT